MGDRIHRLSLNFAAGSKRNPRKVAKKHPPASGGQKKDAEIKGHKSFTFYVPVLVFPKSRKGLANTTFDVL